MKTSMKLVSVLIAVGAGHAWAQENYYQNPVPRPNPVANPAESCVSEICGAPEAVNQLSSQYFDRLSAYMRQGTGNADQYGYPPAVSKMFDELTATVQKQNDAFVAAFKNAPSGSNAHLDGVSKALYNLISVAPYMKDIKYASNVVDGKPVVTVDEAATKAALQSVAPADRAWIIAVVKADLKETGQNSVSDSDLQSQPPNLLLKILHPNSSVQEAMGLEYKQAVGEVASIKDKPMIEQALYFNSTSPDRIAFIGARVADGTITEDESREIIEWNIVYKKSRALFGNPNSVVMTKETPTVGEIIGKAGGADQMLKVYSARRAQDQKNELDHIHLCKLQYFMNKGLLPSKDQVAQLGRDITRAKQMVEDMIKTKFPASMQKNLIDAVEKSAFIKPPSAADFEQSFAQSVQQKIEIAKATLDTSLKVTPTDAQKLFAATVAVDQVQDNSSALSGPNPFCDAFKYEPLTDGNYTTYGNTVLSFSTANAGPEFRLNTIMHELGHTVSLALTNDPKAAVVADKIHKCLAAEHQSAGAVPSLLGDSQFVEEDFADTVAGVSGHAITGKNPWCQMLSLDPQTNQYLESTLEPMPGDTHSASLYRLLHFEDMKKGAVPEACKSVFAASGTTEHFSSCLDVANVGAPAASGPTVQ